MPQMRREFQRKHEALKRAPEIIVKSVAEIRVFYHDNSYDVYTPKDFMRAFGKTLLKAIEGMGGFGQ